jgi:hypothetical protein
MAKKHDHHFYCEHCKAQCMIYRKGKHHRVLVCPHCGVLATNGLGGAIAKIGAKTLLKSIPGVGTAISLAEGAAEIYGAVKGNKQAPTSPTSPTSEHHVRRAGYSTQSKVHDALAR